MKTLAAFFGIAGLASMMASAAALAAPTASSQHTPTTSATNPITVILGTLDVDASGPAFAGKANDLKVLVDGPVAIWHNIKEIPYTATVVQAAGHKPVVTKAFLKVGVWTSFEAVSSKEGHVSVTMTLSDVHLIKTTTAEADGNTIRMPETTQFEVHQVIDVPYGKTVPISLSDKSVGTIRFTAGVSKVTA